MEFEEICKLIYEAIVTMPKDGIVLSQRGKQKIKRIAAAVSDLLDPDTTGGEIVRIKGCPQLGCAYIETQFDCLDVAGKEMGALRNILSEVGGLSMDVNIKTGRVSVILGIDGVYEKIQG